MARAKRTRSRSRSASPDISTANAERALDRLIEQKQQVIGDGSLEVILAIASCTTLVTVDLTTRPPTVTPPNLGSLTFNDPLVGLSNSQMAIFKANLAELLPHIAAEIAKIPENAGLKIAAVAEFVRLALLA